MINPSMAAYVFMALLSVLALFQLALAAGAPWGSLAMGGRFPGRFPPAMRVAAIVQVGVYTLLGAIIVSRAGLALPDWFGISRTAVWGVVALMGVAVLLNLITPSRWERRLWAPVASLMFAAALIVALAD